MARPVKGKKKLFSHETRQAREKGKETTYVKWGLEQASAKPQKTKRLG